MANLLDTLADARAALLAVGPPVLLRGDDDPGVSEVIVLDRVSDTARRYYGGLNTTKLIQVACYAPTIQRSLELATATHAALADAGFRFLQSRPAPGEDVGEIADYQR